MKQPLRSCTMIFRSGLPPAEAFEEFVAELTTALASHGFSFETGPRGRILKRDTPVARVLEWRSSQGFTLTWEAPPWAPEFVGLVKVNCLSDIETCLSVEFEGQLGALGSEAEALGWFASTVISPLLSSLSGTSLANWVTDRSGRRPTGRKARDNYREALHHLPAFSAILELLKLTPLDHILDVGCGGGAFLKLAVRTGCRAAGIDHSQEMIHLAHSDLGHAIETGLAELFEGSAYDLPFPNETFTCATMVGVLGFLADPVLALKEISRTLIKTGRLIVVANDSRLVGTPAMPEPVASQLMFYTDSQLLEMASAAGFRSEVRWINLMPHAERVGIPKEHLPMYEMGTPFVIARK